MIGTTRAARSAKVAPMNDASPVPGTALLTKSLDIVELISDSDNRLKFKDIAERTGHSKSTLYRILSALTARGMIDIDRRDQSYVLGPKFTRMAGSINSSSDLIAVSSGPLKAIADQHGENINLAILSGTAHITISRWQGRLAQPFSSPLGERKPLHATGLGKALIAFLPEADRQRLLGELRFKHYTDKTLTSTDALSADLELCRARGFAVDDNEIIDGITCVAVPVFDPDGQVVASISITAPSHRMMPERRLELASALQAATRHITAQLLTPRGKVATRVATAQALVNIVDARAFSSRALGWSDALGGMVWYDGPAGNLTVRVNGEQRPLAQFARIAAACFLPVGDIAIAADDALWRLDAASGEMLSWLEQDMPGCSAMAALPDGKLLLLSEGALSCLDPATLAVESLAQGLLDEAGLDLAGAVVHAVAAGGRQVVALDLATRRLRHVDLPVEGQISGVVADGQGGFWLAHRLNWSLSHVAAQGRVTHVPTPVPVAQGLVRGRNPAEIYAGSDRISLSQSMLEVAPMAGGLLHVELRPEEA